jgi:NAD(P)-dependent dehydrogenase (short-subunit alcohol dehydrogenase family)
MGGLDQKIAVVTRAGRGIGEAIAAALVRERARVSVIDIDAVPGRRLGAAWLYLDVQGTQGLLRAPCAVRSGLMQQER